MGVVYRARDERLERDVALKVLPPGALTDESARRQFRREALALSKLSHPNIATVHDFDSQEGMDFLVMELVEGETLAERVVGGPLPERDIARLGEQLAEGLSAAHKVGVLHRDIKPSNLRVTPEGRLKILDFGLARVVQTESADATATMTETGVVSGTLPYMSPEQLRGDRLDERTDVWAAGAVLYELSTGRRPFEQQPAARLIAAILHEAPEPPREARAKITPELERIVLKCLEKDPEDRYQGARELAVDLRRVAHPATAQPAPSGRRARHRARSPIRAAGLVATATIAIATGVLGLNVGGLRDRLFGGGSPSAGPSLAVLPLANLSGDPGQDFFADGMTDELITRLAQVASLRVIARTSVMQYKGTRKPLPEIARELGVRMIVEGSVVRAGDVVRISAKLIEAAGGRNLWADSFERSLTNILAVQSEVAGAIVAQVRVEVSPEERVRLASATDVDPRAHEAYLRGLAALNRFTADGFATAIEFFQRATEIDPAWAPAWAGLANAYLYRSGMGISATDANRRARAAAKKAIDIDPAIASAHAALAYIRMNYDRDPDGSLPDFRRAIALNPSDFITQQNYTVTLVVLGRFDEATAQIRRIREIDPLSPMIAGMSLWPLFEGHRFREAAAAAKEILEADPRNQNARMVYGQAHLFLGDHARGVAEIRRATEEDPTNNFPLGWLGYACGVAGQREEALQVLGRLERMSRDGYVQPYLFALIHIGLGDKDEAFRWLDRAVDERSDELLFVRVDPALDSLRSDPRFKVLLGRLGVKT